MPEKKTTHKVGDSVKAKTVTRPEGYEVAVSGGSYVLDVPGHYLIDGNEVEAK